MEKSSMTALVSAFSRAYHSAHNEVKIFDDSVARRLLTDEEYVEISAQMSAGISFFDPTFTGTPEEALRHVTDRQLSPSPLGRAAFAERALRAAVKAGATQYVILGAGYDTFAYRQMEWARGVAVFELDRPAMSREKQERLARAGIAIPQNLHFVAADLAQEGWTAALTRCTGFDSSAVTFCSLLGVTYYLPRTALHALLDRLGALLTEGGAVVFDLPSRAAAEDERSQRQAQLARGANELMFSGYTPQEMTEMLADSGFLVYEHMTPKDVTAQLFADYNRANPAHPITAMPQVDYYLAVRKG